MITITRHDGCTSDAVGLDDQTAGWVRFFWRRGATLMFCMVGTEEHPRYRLLVNYGPTAHSEAQTPDEKELRVFVERDW